MFLHYVKWQLTQCSMCLYGTEKIIGVIKVTLPNIKNIEYFTNGCISQFKNYKNFANLCNHQKYFGLKAKWNFFATSYDKQPCGGMDGTVKRIVSKESLQRPTTKQILSTESMFEYCNCSVGWDCRIHRLLLCRGVRPSPQTSVLSMTLNNLMMRFKQCWSFGEYGVPLYCNRSQVHSGPEW